MSEGRFSGAWLTERLDLLERFCAASLAAQSSDNFTWALLCDEVTDENVMARLREHSADVPDLRMMVTNRERGPTQAIRDIVDPDADILITTRLDSDDALSDGYLEAVQAYGDPLHRSAHRDLLVSCPHGYRYDSRSNELFAEWMSFNPFHSLLERPGKCEVKTVLHGGHGRLHYEHMTHQDESDARWMIVVHGNNLINKIHAGLQKLEGEMSDISGFSLSAR